MIDEQGYRYGVGIVLVNANRQVFLGKRLGMDAWQFPQGGMSEGETTEQTMYRELWEEIGLYPEDVKILAETTEWHHYDLPKRLIRRHTKPLCIGQKQKWFLLSLANKEAKINLLASETPEFDSWAWVSYWYPLRQIISFKKQVYEKVMQEFAPFILSRRYTS